MSSTLGHMGPKEPNGSFMRDQMGFSMVGPVRSLKLPFGPEDEDLEEATEDMTEEDTEEEDTGHEDIEENMEEDGEVKGKRSSTNLDGKRPYGFGLGKRSSSGLQPVLEGTDRRDLAKRAIYSLYGKRGFLWSRWE